MLFSTFFSRIFVGRCTLQESCSYRKCYIINYNFAIIFIERVCVCCAVASKYCISFLSFSNYVIVILSCDFFWIVHAYTHTRISYLFVAAL